MRQQGVIFASTVLRTGKIMAEYATIAKLTNYVNKKMINEFEDK